MIIIILREELLTISSEINCFVSHTPSKYQYSKKLVNFIGFCCVDVYSLKLLFQLQALSLRFAQSTVRHSGAAIFIYVRIVSKHSSISFVQLKILSFTLKK